MATSLYEISAVVIFGSVLLRVTLLCKELQGNLTISKQSADKFAKQLVGKTVEFDIGFKKGSGEVISASAQLRQQEEDYSGD